MNNKLLIILIALVIISSCKPRQKEPFGRNTQLENRRWTCRELNGKPVTINPGGKELVITFNMGDNTFSGDGGCNKMNGMYTAQEQMIKIQSMMSTKMACEGMVMENDFFQVLDKTNRYELKKKREGGVDKEYLFLFQDDTLLAKLDAVYL
ncbi:hypothetical protein BH11BAC2_BH11BAC2_03350 [soil metagenome]